MEFFCYWIETKVIQLRNVILVVYQNPEKSFIKLIIPINRDSPPSYEQPFSGKIIRVGK
jgi:hypothetical protein